MKVKVTFRYKGWLGLCPIYVSELDNPVCMARWEWMEWWHEINIIMFQAMGQGFAIRITGQLPKPIVSWEEW